MVEKTIEDTKNYYDGIARGYGQLYHGEQIKKIKLILEDIPSDGNILDLGSGDGVLNQFVNNRVELFSFDLSEELLKLNPNSEKNKFQGSISKLPFENERFDCVCSFTVFQDLANLNKCLDESFRVLKKEGKFILTFLKMSKNKKIIENYILTNYKIDKKVEEEKDMIYILKK